MTGVWSWVILIIVIGMVSTFETLLIGSMVLKAQENKMKLVFEYEIKATDRLMECLKTLIDYTTDKITKLENR